MFVGNLRKDIIKPFNDTPRTATRGGVTYTINTANIGKRTDAPPPPPPLLPAPPPASIAAWCTIPTCRGLACLPCGQPLYYYH